VPTHAFARWLFFRLLGLVYFCAFGSLALQIAGLVGPQGILPAGLGDAALRALCLGGAALSAALVLGILPIVTTSLLWAGYLWLSNLCGEFLWYQWDALLLEAGLLAILIAPPTLRDRASAATDPPRIAVWLMWWLTFRLMLGSGAVKLASGDPTWHDLTALTFHYETQPIPNPIAYYAHHLPAGVNKAATATTLAIELIAPFMILGPRRLKIVAAAMFVGLQAVIALTGNFAFFNLLSAALCVFLVDDDAWGETNRYVASAPRRAVADDGSGPARAGRHMANVIAMAAAVVIVPVSLLTFASSVGVLLPGWQIVVPVADLTAPLRSVNSYGLFAVMTTTRPEIVVEGSDDGRTWTPYEFKYKPGDLKRRPPWVAPHQPRLDWQMWFAALGRYEENAWFRAFCVRLLEASPAVLALLEHDPFDGRRPRYVRGMLYRYRFAPRDAHRDEGLWWTRERLGEYSPPMSLGQR
jgi:hypothetical protein